MLCLIIAALDGRREDGRGGGRAECGQPVDQDFHVADGDKVGFDDEGLGARDAMASTDFRELFNGGDGAADLEVAAGNGEAHKDADGNADFGHVENRVVAGDNASVFKAADALGNCRRGEADFAAQFGKRLARIALQGFEDLPGNGIEFDDILASALNASRSRKNHVSDTAIVSMSSCSSALELLILSR